jgi:hypothetical protein
MATTPTDDPLANSDRTVGVIGDPDSDLKSLKQEVLLFDQIALPGLDFLLAMPMPTHGRFREDCDELAFLQDIGIVRNIRSFDHIGLVHPTPIRQYLAALVAETGEPIDVMAIPDARLRSELWSRMPRGPDVHAVESRMYSSYLRREEGITAFPILPTRRQIGSVFPSGTSPVLEVILKSMPIPDDQTPWQDIIEFRNDPESQKRLRRLRVWTRKFAKATTATSLAEMKQEIDVLLDDYEEHMKLHRMKVNKGTTQTLVTVAGKVAEDFVKLKWGELAKLPFILRERKISLLEAELKAPHRELAYISIARSRFSR